MLPSSVDQLLADLLRLPVAERRELLARLALAEKDGRTGKGRELDMWTVACYSALLRVQGGQSGAGAGPAALKRLLSDSSAWGPVQDFLRGSRLSELEVPRLQSVLNLLASLLADHALHAARKAGLPLTPRFLASCAPNLAAVFDASFPGYLGSPVLMALVATRLTAKRKETEE